MGNKYEKAYKLDTIRGVTAFLNNYHKIAEARFFASDLSISDLLVDFDYALKKALTDRQREIITLLYFKDMRQEDVAKLLNLRQQTVQEHSQKAIKNLATYHMILKKKEVEE